MSVRKLELAEIQAVGVLVKDKDSIELLKKIRENEITEEDLKGKHKGNNLENFVGFAQEQDLIGEGEADKKVSLTKLVSLGLVDEGYHIPLPRSTKSNEGAKVPKVEEETLNKYKVSETGLALLAVIDPKLVNGVEEKQGNEQQKVNQQLADEALNRNKSAGKEFVPPKIEEKEEVTKQPQSKPAKVAQAENPTPERKKPNKAGFPQDQSSPTNANDLDTFKVEQDKELGKKK
jgi:hypothetical protein